MKQDIELISKTVSYTHLDVYKRQRKPYVTELLEGRQGPAVAATDYVRGFADQIRAFVPMRYTCLLYTSRCV